MDEQSGQPLIDELAEFCARVLGRGDAAMQAAEEARGRAAGDDRVQLLAAAAAACRAREVEPRPPKPLPPRVPAPAAGAEPHGLAQAVAGELASATARLPQRQREALALRELLGLSHDQIARVIGIDAVAVAPLLARARLRLRTQLRGDVPVHPGCAERERSLRVIARRQDTEPVAADDTTWLMDHLGHCSPCNQAHAAMLEASVCYRAWREPAGERSGVDGGEPGTGSAAD
jgi:RNA polymerase sigma factor (sigma-70 family)